MNYLAHACLSFGRPDILVGNMISDHIKGKKQFDYPKATTPMRMKQPGN
jgi:acyl carrier protein phosphodiesterase